MVDLFVTSQTKSDNFSTTNNATHISIISHLVTATSRNPKTRAGYIQTDNKSMLKMK